MRAADDYDRRVEPGRLVALAEMQTGDRQREQVMLTTTKIYGVCKACGELVYREPGKQHDDGQIDSDESPVWLIAACICRADTHSPETCNPDCGCPKCWDTWPDNAVNCGCNN